MGFNSFSFKKSVNIFELFELEEAKLELCLFWLNLFFLVINILLFVNLDHFGLYT